MLEGTLTQTLKQCYGVCCHIRYELKEVQWGDVNNMKMISRNFCSPISLIFRNICIEIFWVLSLCKHSCIPTNFQPLYLLTSMVTLLMDQILQNQPVKARQASVQCSVQKITSQLFAFALFNWRNNTSDQDPHRPAKVSSQSQLSQVHVFTLKQFGAIGQGYHFFSTKGSRSKSSWV